MLCKVCDGEAIVIVSRESNLYEMNFTKVHEADVANLVQSPTGYGVFKLWHRRLSHLNRENIYKLQNMLSGIDLGKLICPTSSLLCEVYIEGKQHRLAFSELEGRKEATKPLEILYSDVCGPMKTTYMGGAKYFVTFIKDLSIKV